jgi:hypothetical protein
MGLNISSMEGTPFSCFTTLIAALLTSFFMGGSHYPPQCLTADPIASPLGPPGASMQTLSIVFQLTTTNLN